jgi:hypothetical protein
VNNPCAWPQCLTKEQRQVLCENIRRSMFGEENVGPDPMPDCDCPERLAVGFEVYAAESLAIANETFDAVVEAWPKE